MQNIHEKKYRFNAFYDIKVEFNAMLSYLAEFLFCCKYDNYLLVFFNIMEEILKL